MNGRFRFVAGVLWWMLCGALVALAIMALRGKRLHGKREDYAPYAERLGKPCLMYDRRSKDFRKFRVVAVSHKGAISVRRWDDESGKGAFWVPGNKVAECVSFDFESAAKHLGFGLGGDEL